MVHDGKKYRLCLTTDKWAKYENALAGETTNSINLTADALEVTNKSSVWRQYIAGLRGATINATIYADNSDKAQKEMLDAITQGLKVAVEIADETGEGYYCEGFVTSVNIIHQNGAIASRDVTIQVDDELGMAFRDDDEE